MRRELVTSSKQSERRIAAAGFYDQQRHREHAMYIGLGGLLVLILILWLLGVI
jgi:type II secretory pathway component PulM